MKYSKLVILLLVTLLMLRSDNLSAEQVLCIKKKITVGNTGKISFRGAFTEREDQCTRKEVQVIAGETAADIITKLQEVDGAGSSLDADSLDGNSSSYFATASELSSLSSTVSSAQEDINSIESDVSLLQSSHDSDLTSVESSITSLESDTSSLESSVSSLNSSMSSITSRVNSAESTISSHSSSISTLQSSVSTNGSSISSLNTDLGTAESNITTLQTNVSSNSSAITAVGKQSNIVRVGTSEGEYTDLWQAASYIYNLRDDSAGDASSLEHWMIEVGPGVHSIVAPGGNNYLDVPINVRIKGSGKETTILRGSQAGTKAEFSSLISLSEGASLSDLTIENVSTSGNVASCVAVTETDPMNLGSSEANPVKISNRIERVILRSQGVNAENFGIATTTDLLLDNVEIHTSNGTVRNVGVLAYQGWTHLFDSKITVANSDGNCTGTACEGISGFTDDAGDLTLKIHHSMIDSAQTAISLSQGSHTTSPHAEIRNSELRGRNDSSAAVITLADDSTISITNSSIEAQSAIIGGTSGAATPVTCVYVANSYDGDTPDAACDFTP